jgi:hypothetical protein
MFWHKKSVIAGGPLLVGLLLFLGLRYDLFESTFWYDLFMHTLSGGVLAVSFSGVIWHLRMKHSGADFSIGLRFAVIAFVLLASVVWEWGEVLLGMTPNWTLSVSDTVSDVLCGLVGAVAVLYGIRTPHQGS